MPPPAPGRDVATKLRHPVAFVVEYADGLRATVLILNGHVDDTTIAARIGDAGGRREHRLDPDVPARAPGRELLQPARAAH